MSRRVKDTIEGTITNAKKAAKADALSSGAGSATQPVYINSSGKPTATTYTLGKSVPSDAKFTDTVTTVNDTLTSNSASEALSAKQGKALKDLVDKKADKSALIFITSEPATDITIE